jgi:hypothetical protein
MEKNEWVVLAGVIFPPFQNIQLTNYTTVWCDDDGEGHAWNYATKAAPSLPILIHFPPAAQINPSLTLQKNFRFLLGGTS